ncbi:Gfo/Idh/MocA family protein [Paenibacillus silviterrae]|uniref:Gfo/Idh/MocA family protein n=1 Tax=Paenibacillus silviterrae TaxID=3242194 RepID=UPI002542C70B|nr:Gfo/Idh/MocA family oxidoreductase [Paenibacillus chinjuensis]
MKAILVGLGSAGFSWYKRLKAQGLLAAVVETNSSMKTKLENDPYPFYTSLEEALNNEEADFLVNVTSPMAHTAINHAAFDRRLPVLCEKPISFDYEESVEVVKRALREGIPFMIAENYRRFPYIRRLKQLIDEGAIGRIASIDIRFHRYHQVQRNYTVSLLDDIGVHHFDMIRYLTGAEGVRVAAQLYNPLNGWEEPGSVLGTEAWIDLEGGIRATYSGTIASRSKQTPWCGQLRIEGTDGALELTDQVIYLHREGQTEVYSDHSAVQVSDTLAEFLASLRERRECESSGRDYLLTQALVHYAKLSSEKSQRVDVILPCVTE